MPFFTRIFPQVFTWYFHSTCGGNIEFYPQRMKGSLNNEIEKCPDLVRNLQERDVDTSYSTLEWQGSSPCFTSWPLLDLFSRAEEIYYKTNKGDPIFQILQQYWGRQSVELDDERDKSVSQSVSKIGQTKNREQRTENWELRTENCELKTGFGGFWVFN